VPQSSIYRTFKQGVGRRILGFFMLAGIVPVIFTGYLAYTENGRNLEQDVRQDLRQGSKAYGMEIFSRLQRASAKAGEIQRIANRNGAAALSAHPYLLNDFESIWYIGENGGPNVIYGSGETPIESSSIDAAFLSTGEAQLLFTSDADQVGMVLLRALRSEQAASSVMAFRLDVGKLWEAPENLPYVSDVCVFTAAGENLSCTQDMHTADVYEILTANADPERITPNEWQLDEEVYFGATWQLFLAGQFRASALNIVASVPKLQAMESSADFRRIFIPALLLVIILVGALSFKLIGESLTPLKRLTMAAHEFAGGDMESRVYVRSGDEFERLANAFNDMAGKMGRQISTMKTMSGIDQLILSGAKFDEVTEGAIHQLSSLTGCDAAAVIARDNDSQNWAKMISSYKGDFNHERVGMPMDAGRQWREPCQVDLDTVDASVAPYKPKFQTYGQNYVVIIPIALGDELKGVLLLGFKSQFDMSHERLSHCIDLAGRFAVVLASVERDEALYRKAHFDDLTGLPNRQLLKDRLHQQIVTARREGGSGAVLFLDLDQFKTINDVHGHSVGDIVLTQAAERIVADVRDQDTVARLGGDEFVVVLPNLHTDAIVTATATRLLSRLNEAFSVRGKDHFMSASIGIVMFPEDGDSVETLLKNADSAMYRAKDAGRARFEFFSRKLNAESRRKIDLERDLRSAFQKKEIEVYYQPQFDISTGVISGAEALLRWKHEKLG